MITSTSQKRPSSTRYSDPDDAQVMPKCDHHTFYVVSTQVVDVILLLHCPVCGANAIVEDSTTEEWGKAFHALSQPYLWDGGYERVVLLDDNNVPIRGEK